MPSIQTHTATGVPSPPRQPWQLSGHHPMGSPEIWDAHKRGGAAPGLSWGSVPISCLCRAVPWRDAALGVLGEGLLLLQNHWGAEVWKWNSTALLLQVIPMLLLEPLASRAVPQLSTFLSPAEPLCSGSDPNPQPRVLLPLGCFPLNFWQLSLWLWRPGKGYSSPALNISVCFVQCNAYFIRSASQLAEAWKPCKLSGIVSLLLYLFVCWVFLGCHFC